MSDLSTLRLVRVAADDDHAVHELTLLTNEANTVDDPDAPRVTPGIIRGRLAYGWDLDPDEEYLAYAEGSAAPVGRLALELPRRDNRHLVWAEITVHPDHRRRGHGTVLMHDLHRRVAEAGRSTIWMGTAADNAGAQEFLSGFGFRYANPDARRRQRLADVDHAAIDVLFAGARGRAADYELERLRPPYSEDLLLALVDATAAINDAPMGDLSYEDEVFDLDRLRDIETARVGRGDDVYRVVARHRETGEIGGHTAVFLNPDRPTFGEQGDTAVARAHRGHRLGLLLKIDMMRWLAEAEPQLEVIETFNQAGNDFMISVNELLGYRLNRVFHTYELQLG